MKSSKMTIFSRSLRRIVTKFLMVAIVASMAIMVGCSEEVINDPYAKMQEGVILPKKKAYFGAGVIRIPVTTAAGFTVDVENHVWTSRSWELIQSELQLSLVYSNNGGETWVDVGYVYFAAIED